MKLLVFLSLVCLAYGVRRRLLKEPHVADGTPLPPDEWFQQRLDHFDPTNKNIWKQRFFTNDTFFSKGINSPVFLMIGGEGEASPKWMVQGAWLEYAAIYGALCFQLEHRFYGKSHPTEDMSVANLRYLTSEQALADLAYFIEGMNSKYSLKPSNKWIVFGGSYPGSLAAWARFKYPHLIHGAMSASGPLLAKADFKEYFQVVNDSLNTYPSQKKCSDAVHEAMKEVKDVLSQRKNTFVEDFHVCKNFDSSNKNDVSTLVENLSNIFADVVQYNKDNRFTAEVPPLVIEDLCLVMVDESQGTPYDRLAKLNKLVLDRSNKTCLEYSYKIMITDLKTEDWESEASEGGRQWTYQTCVEFGFYQTSSSDNELFLDYMPVNWYIQQCSDIYGKIFSEKLLNNGMERTNTIYGALDLKVSRVVFVHGSIDPWHALGIIETKQQTAPAIFINGTAHCANMYPSKESDPAPLRNARKRITKLIGRWLKEDYSYFDHL